MRKRLFLSGLLWLGATGAWGETLRLATANLKSMSLEELSSVEVISVSRRSEKIANAPAAVFVITAEDIRRSGALSLPDVLRLAPNLQVARMNAASYAIAARGFGTLESANKLLVLIDGRSIYTPLHAGVFWDQQQLMLEDIDRIEVISGPGGTLWGANAVNGVINIITRSARDTQGGLASGQAGAVDVRGALRYGGALGESAHFRVFAQTLERDHSLRADGSSALDDWDSLIGGFRADWTVADHSFTAQGTAYDNSFRPDGDIEGQNLRMRWNHALTEDSSFELQGYYDNVDRTSPGAIDALETFDLLAQHSFFIGSRHQLIWGGGYRVNRDRFEVAAGSLFVVDPAQDKVRLGNVFFQDSIALRQDLTLTLGSKLEHSSFTGWEYLPSARLAWQAADHALLWSAVSRAVRTPSRIDRGLIAASILERATQFDAEKLIAYEAGYRGQPLANTALSVSVFYNDYQDLRILATSPDSGLLRFDNRMQGHTYGVEVWADYWVRPSWRLSAGWSELRKDLSLQPGAIALALDQHAGNDPKHQLSLRSYLNLFENLEFDLGLRAVDELPNPAVEDYLELDARLAWHVSSSLELAVSGSNLLDAHHPETGPLATRGEVRRSVYAGLQWSF